MAIPDFAGLGISAGQDFDPDAFRNAIKFAMQMGKSPNPDLAPSFRKSGGVRTFWKDGVELDPTTVRTGRDGEPLDFDVEIREPEPVTVTVDCALEVSIADPETLPVGNYSGGKITVTLLDVDYQQISDCRELLYNGDRHRLGFHEEAIGLFGVGVHTIVFYTVDES